jgi:hypothetical protein
MWVWVLFNDLQNMFPDRVLLGRLEDIFRAWQISHDTSLPSHEKVSRSRLTSRTMASFTPPVNPFLWILLITAEKITTSALDGCSFRMKLSAHFKSILAGAKSVMGVVASDRIYGQVLYHEYDERVDFLFRNQDESSHVLVSFEPGFPEHFHKDDHWGEFWIRWYLRERENITQGVSRGTFSGAAVVSIVSVGTGQSIRRIVLKKCVKHIYTTCRWLLAIDNQVDTEMKLGEARRVIETLEQAVQIDKQRQEQWDVADACMDEAREVERSGDEYEEVRLPEIVAEIVKDLGDRFAGGKARHVLLQLMQADGHQQLGEWTEAMDIYIGRGRYRIRAWDLYRTGALRLRKG